MLASKASALPLGDTPTEPLWVIEKPDGLDRSEYESLSMAKDIQICVVRFNGFSYQNEQKTLLFSYLFVFFEISLLTD
jgi:hypothetical protein